MIIQWILFLEILENNLDCIVKRQFGFRKQRSTIDAVSKITTKIFDRFRRKEKTAVIFFNINKPYDKVNRDKTLE